MSAPRIIAVITARAGSKGIPGKNLVPLAGHPLIYWSILAAQKSGRCDRIIVSTDGPDIAEYCRSIGVEVPFLRPSDLATDGATHLDVMNHALDWLRADGCSEEDFFLLLQPTSPLRTGEDVNAAIDLVATQGAPGVVSVRPVKDHPFWCNHITPEGTLQPFFNDERVMRQRQACGPVYVLNGALYLNQLGRFRAQQKFIVDGAMAYVMPSERSFDVDSPIDLALIDLMLRTQNPHHA